MVNTSELARNFGGDKMLLLLTKTQFSLRTGVPKPFELRVLLGY